MTASDHVQGGGVQAPSAPPAGAAETVSTRVESVADANEAHPPLGSSRYGYTFRRLLLVCDVLALSGAVAAASLASTLAGRGGLAPSDVLLIAALLPVWLLLAHGAGLYHVAERRIDHTMVDELGPVFMTTTAWIWLVVLMRSAVSSEDATLLWPAVLWGAGVALVLLFRALSRALAANRDWYRQHVVLIGEPDEIERVLRRIRRHPEWGLDAVATIRRQDSAFVVDHLESNSQVRYSEQIQTNGSGLAPSAEDVADTVRGLNASRAIVAGASRSLSERTELIRVLARDRICVDYVSGEPETLYSSAVLHHLEGLPILSVQPTQLTRGASGLKRTVDVIASGLGLILLSPVFAYTALRIKLDSPGPVFFRHGRVGKDGQTFGMLKFRTMTEGADELRDAVRDQSIHNGGAAMLKVKGDPRITKFGATLRRWSLDELPQLWNVLRGDMSLVGPRPLPLDEAPLVKDHFLERTRMRPGITGPWQTQGRSDIPFEDMVKLDYTYVVGWSMREDLRLLLRTVAAVFGKRGAY